MIKCKNCSFSFEGNYCNNCGQTAKTERISFKFLWEDVQHGILHYDKGIVYTAKQLFLKPGHVIKDYINGKRVGHFRPLSLVIVLSSIYVLIFHLTKVNVIETSNNLGITLYQKLIEHYYWFVIATIPFFTLGTSISFGKRKYNFWEYFIFECFKTSQRSIIHILFLPVYLFTNSDFIEIITSILTFVDLSLIVWTNIQFFNDLSKTEVFLRSILSYLICLILTLALVVVFSQFIFKIS